MLPLWPFTDPFTAGLFRVDGVEARLTLSKRRWDDDDRVSETLSCVATAMSYLLARMSDVASSTSRGRLAPALSQLRRRQQRSSSSDM